MSVLRVNEIVNADDNGPVEFTRGVTVGDNATISGSVIINAGSGIVTATSFSVSQGLSVSGVVTATSFVGDGSQITGLSAGTSTGKAIALTLIT
jgi:hypothetical protein